MPGPVASSESPASTAICHAKARLLDTTGLVSRASASAMLTMNRFATDLLLFSAALIGAYLIRFEGDIPERMSQRMLVVLPYVEASQSAGAMSTAPEERTMTRLTKRPARRGRPKAIRAPGYLPRRTW